MFAPPGLARTANPLTVTPVELFEAAQFAPSLLSLELLHNITEEPPPSGLPAALPAGQGALSS